VLMQSAQRPALVWREETGTGSSLESTRARMYSTRTSKTSTPCCSERD